MDEEGNKLCYQKILDRLQQARVDKDHTDAESARRFFDGNLDHPDAGGRFRYIKTGRWCLYTKDQKVAEKWRELLREDPDVAARWAMQAMVRGR